MFDANVTAQSELMHYFFVMSSFAALYAVMRAMFCVAFARL
jgi:hypothetical protein